MHDILTDTPELITDPSCQKTQLAEHYLEQAAQNLNFDALCKLVSKFEKLQPKTNAEYRDAMKFWMELFILTSNALDTGVPEHTQKMNGIAENAYTQII